MNGYYWRLKKRAGRKYDSDQPRVPAGSPEGGRWTAAAGSGVSSIIRARAGMHEVGKLDEGFAKVIQGWAGKTNADVFGKGKAVEAIEVVTEPDTWEKLFPDHPNALGVLSGTTMFIDGTWRESIFDQTEWVFHHEVGHAILERSEGFGDWYRTFRDTDRFHGYTAFQRTGDPIKDAREAFSDAYALTRVREPAKVNPHPGEKELFDAVEQVVKGYR